VGKRPGLSRGGGKKKGFSFDFASRDHALVSGSKRRSPGEEKKGGLYPTTSLDTGKKEKEGPLPDHESSGNRTRAKKQSEEIRSWGGNAQTQFGGGGGREIRSPQGGEGILFFGQFSAEERMDVPLFQEKGGGTYRSPRQRKEVQRPQSWKERDFPVRENR